MTPCLSKSLFYGSAGALVAITLLQGCLTTLNKDNPSAGLIRASVDEPPLPPGGGEEPSGIITNYDSYVVNVLYRRSPESVGEKDWIKIGEIDTSDPLYSHACFFKTIVNQNHPTNTYRTNMRWEYATTLTGSWQLKTARNTSWLTEWKTSNEVYTVISNIVTNE